MKKIYSFLLMALLASAAWATTVTFDFAANGNTMFDGITASDTSSDTGDFTQSKSNTQGDVTITVGAGAKMYAVYGGGIELRMYEIDVISNCALNLFLSMVLMSLNIAKLVSLAGPMIVILLAQAVVMMLWAYFVTFNTTGRDYDAAVMAAGHCGVGLGQTPNAVANMAAVIDKNGPAPTAWFVLPVVTVIFINIMNPIVITFFINLLK